MRDISDGWTNRSGLKPLGHAVLVKPYEVKSAVILVPDSVKDSTVAAEQRVVVIEPGPLAWIDERHPRAAPGDHVLCTKYAGYKAIGPLDGETYRVVNDRDIFIRISEEALEKENG